MYDFLEYTAWLRGRLSQLCGRGPLASGLSGTGPAEKLWGPDLSARPISSSYPGVCSGLCRCLPSVSSGSMGKPHAGRGSRCVIIRTRVSIFSRGAPSYVGGGSLSWERGRPALPRCVRDWGCGKRPRAGTCRIFSLLAEGYRYMRQTAEARGWPLSPQRGTIALAGANPAIWSWGMFSASNRNRPPPAGQILGTLRRHESSPAVAGAGEDDRSMRLARSCV